MLLLSDYLEQRDRRKCLLAREEVYSRASHCSLLDLSSSGNVDRICTEKWARLETKSWMLARFPGLIRG
jgi:hypothetical protein